MKKIRSAKKSTHKPIKNLTEQKKPFNFVPLGFLIPFVVLGLALLIRSIIYEASGSSIFSLLHSDAYHQYYPFFVSFRRTLRDGASLLWNWDVGMGMDFWALIAYYLGSPLNLLSIFVPDAWLVDYFTFLTPLRISLASLFFTIMLNKLFGKNDLSIALFGAFYGTCAWVFGYLWNSMWMDTFALLPLVVLGTVQLLKDRKFILYTISLFLSVAINYYIGFFTCIFTLLVFICYQICRWQNFKRFGIDLALMALFTVIAIGMTAYITLPTLASLQTTSSAANEFPNQFALNIVKDNTFLGLLDAMKQVATNTFAATMPNVAATEGLPNIYSGTFANIFIFLFLTCKHIKWRDRICGLLMLLFLNASFCIRQLDYIWHGFHFTNMIPYRFSFMYSFVMLYMAYRAWLLRRRMRTWQVLVAGALTIVMMLSSNATKQFTDVLADPNFTRILQQGLSGGDLSAMFNQLSEFVTLDFFSPFVSSILILGYLAGLLCYTLRIPTSKAAPKEVKRARYAKFRARRSFAGIFLLCVISAELLLNIGLYSVYAQVVNLAYYPRGTKDSARIISVMKEREEDTLFYRAETAHTQTFNDGALNDFHGITTFSSSSNASVTTFMTAMGLGAAPSWNRYAYEISSPITNMFLNLKYLIERQFEPSNDTYWTTIHNSGKVHLMENNFYLPLGFLVDPGLAKISAADPGNRFSFQNNFLSAAIGHTVTPWTSVTGDDLVTSSTESVTLSSVSSSGSSNFSTGSKSGSIFYTYTIQESGYFCLRFNLPKRNAITVSYDDGSGYRTLFTEDCSLAYTMACCDVKPGDRIQVTLKCKPNQSGLVQVFGSLLNKQIVESAYKYLSQSTLELTKFSNTLVEGTINCNRDGLLYTSIPQQDDNWHVYVDGKEQEVTLIGDAMVGVMLTEGNHTVTFRYRNDEFITGLIVSLVCAAAFGAIIWLQYAYLPKRSGKFSKKSK